MANAWFKPGVLFMSSSILQTKHELTSKAASKAILLRLLRVRSRNAKPVLLDHASNVQNY